MKTLNKTREEKLIGAVKEAVSLVDNGNLSPDEALTKMARREKWGQDMIRFAAQAYNTGRQTAQRESNTDVLEKMSEFPIADPAKVIDNVFPKTVKSAVDIELEVGVSSEYEKPPTWLDVQPRPVTAFTKSAADVMKAATADPPPAYPPDPNVKMAKAYNCHVDHKRAVETARHKMAAARENVIGAMGRVREYFKYNPGEMDAAFKAAEIYEYGTKVATDKLYDYVVQQNDMGKIVQAADGSLSRERHSRQDADVCYMTVNPDLAPFSLIKECMDLGAVLASKATEHRQAVAAFDKQAAELLPFVQRPPSSLAHPLYLIDEPVKAAAGPAFMGGAMVGGETKNLLESALADPETEKLEEAEMEELNDPSHMNELRRIRAQSLMAEMMDDPVIGGHDPEQVMSAFNDISMMAPRASMQPIAVRALLRRQLQGNLEPFESKEITDIETGLRQTQDQQPSFQPPTQQASPANVS